MARHPMRIGLRLRRLDTFQIEGKRNFSGDELIGRCWVKYLERREDVARVDIYDRDAEVADDLDVLIHFDPTLEKHPSIPNVCYWQNAYREKDHPGGLPGVFARHSGDFKAHIFTSTVQRDACAPGAVIPFCTDPEFFTPTWNPALAFPVSFVGNCIRSPRDNARYLAPAIPFGLGLYGNRWGGRPYARVWRGKLPMPDLPAIYTSSLINLNLTIAEHVELELINLRIYDALACGGFVISDPVASIEPTFGDAVVQTRGKRDLRNQLEHFLADPEERARRAREGRALVLAHHTYASRVEDLMGFLQEAL